MKLDDLLQWIGAVGVIGGHVLNAVGPAAYPYNIIAFFVGTCFFMIWSTRVMNRPQTLVNTVALTIGVLGLYRAFL
jgi:hypothetical protein